MKSYFKYLDDENFLIWVYKPNVENDAFWQDYIRNNPNGGRDIEELKAVLLKVKPVENRIPEDEKQDILIDIFNKINQRKKSSKLFKLNKWGGKFAAILLIALCTGLYLYNNLSQKNNFPFRSINIIASDSISNTKLIFSSGNEYVITNKESIIEYTPNKEVLVNHRDTINSGAIVNNKPHKEESLNTLIVPYGRRSKIVLSDGTIVHLNAGTQFVFPEKFVGKNRTVYLSGEGFFEVEKNKNKPFLVKTIDNNLSIEVVGTKFNVSAYPLDSNITTVLTEGKVNVIQDKLFGKTKTAILPGELCAWYKKKGDVKVKQVDTDDYTLWTQGVVRFRSQYLKDVVKKVERYYNVEIEFEESFNSRVRITGKLTLEDNINRTLKNLVGAAACKYEKENNKYIIKKNVFTN